MSPIYEKGDIHVNNRYSIPLFFLKITRSKNITKTEDASLE